MDIQLEPKTFKQKLFSYKSSVIKVSLALFILIWLLYAFKGNRVDRTEIRIATVSRGDIISQVEGSGTIKVSGLHSFYSPVDSYVKDVFKREGHLVEINDTLLVIDSGELDKHILELKNRIKISENNLRTKEIEFKVLQVQNKKNKELYETRKEQHQYELQAAEKLFKIGATSESNVLVKKAELKKDEIDLKYLEETQTLQQQKLAQEIKTLRLTIDISKNELHFQNQLKKQTVLVATEQGAVSKQSFLGGEKLQKGELVAQISNLKNFVVEAQFSQRQFDKLSPGQQVAIRINKKEYSGYVSLVHPEIRNGYGLAEIVFAKNQSLQLKQNQRAEVFVRTGIKKNTLYVERGAFLSSGGRYAFKVSENTASKHPISTGARNHEIIEITSGLKEGDRIITSQIASFMEWDSFKIN